MKIYVSDKDIDYYITYGNGYEALELNKREPIIIINIEQHEAEIRQKAIAELEEWCEENKIIVNALHDVKNYEYINLEKLKQKLNDMKGAK